MDCSLPGSSVHGISRPEYWSGLPFPSPGDLPDPRIKPEFLRLLHRLVGSFSLVGILCAVLSHSVVSDSLRPPWAVAHQAPLSLGIPEAGILEWVVMPSSRRSSHPRDRTTSPTLQADSLPAELTKEARKPPVSRNYPFLQISYSVYKKKGGFSHGLHRKKVQKDNEKERRVRIRAKA